MRKIVLELKTRNTDKEWIFMKAVSLIIENYNNKKYCYCFGRLKIKVLFFS